MESYQKEVRERIKQLEEEIKSLRKSYHSKNLLDKEKLHELLEICGYDAMFVQERVSYLSRFACTYVKSGKSKFKKITDLNYDEFERVKKCSSEILDILLKYAKETNNAK